MLKQKIEEDLKSAMRENDTVKRSSLRMLISAIRNKEIEVGKKESGLSDDEVLSVILSEAKRRRDSMSEFEKGGRTDLVEEESNELKILQTYLPAEISDEEVRLIIQKGIISSGASSSKDFGAVMRVIMPELKGKASGDRISALLKQTLEKES